MRLKHSTSGTEVWVFWRGRERPVYPQQRKYLEADVTAGWCPNPPFGLLVRSVAQGR